MKKIYILFFLAITFVNLVNAQDNVVFRVNSPSALAATYANGTNYTSSQSSSLTSSGNNWGRIMGIGSNVTGEVVVMRDTSTVDTVAQYGCNPALRSGLSLAGKVALIRRGTCGFSLKAYAAWKLGASAVIIYNNRPNELINMSATRPQADSVNIPCIFVTQDIGEGIRNAVQGGQTVNVSFFVPAFYDAMTNYNLLTPSKEVQDLRGVTNAFLANPGTTNRLNAQIKVDVTAPNGTRVSYKGKVDTLRPASGARIYIDSTFRPTQIGTYNLVYSNNVTTDTIRETIRVSDFVFSEDRGTITGSTAIDSASFISGGLLFDVGHIFYNGISTDRATHAAFAIRNPADFPRNDQFVVMLFEFTDAVFTRFNNGTLTYDDMTPLAIKPYAIKGTERPDSLIFVEFTTPVALNDTSAYMLMVRYDGTSAATGKRPSYTAAGAYDNPLFYTDVVYAWSATSSRNVFYSGWAGATKNIVRMYMQGFRPPVGTKDLPAWAENSVSVFPNPLSNGQLNVQFDLAEFNETVEVTISDLMGRTLKTVKLTNVQSGVQTIDVSELADDQYFARIVGKDGWRTKVFQVVK